MTGAPGLKPPLRRSADRDLQAASFDNFVPDLSITHQDTGACDCP